MLQLPSRQARRAALTASPLQPGLAAAQQGWVEETLLKGAVRRRWCKALHPRPVVPKATFSNSKNISEGGDS